MQTTEFLEEAREDVERHRHPAHQPHGAREFLLRLGNARGGLLDVVEHADGELEHRFPGRRDLDLALDAPEERLVQLCFEQQDLAADRRLRDVKPPARAGERSRIGDGF